MSRLTCGGAWQVADDIDNDSPDGFLIAEPFVTLPNREEYPDYYQIIKRPLSLEEIVDKLHGRAYKALDELRLDAELICNNAKRYNLKDSTIWTLAKRLHLLVKEAITAVMEEGDLPEGLKPATITHDPADPEVIREFDSLAGLESDAGSENSEQTALPPKGKKAAAAKGKGKANAAKDAANTRLSDDKDGAASKPKTKITIKPPKRALEAEVTKSEEDGKRSERKEPATAATVATASGKAAAPAAPEALAASEQLAPAPKRTSSKGKTATPVSLPAPLPPMASSPQPSLTPLPTTGQQVNTPFAAGGTRAYGSPDPTRGSHGNTSNSRNPTRGKYLKVALKTWVKSILDLQRPDGSSVAEYFKELPNRAENPDYYKHIASPISMAEIEVRTFFVSAAALC